MVAVTELLVDVVLVLAVVVLAPMAVAWLLFGVVAVFTAAGDVRSRRRMRRQLDELIRDRRVQR